MTIKSKNNDFVNVYRIFFFSCILLTMMSVEIFGQFEKNEIKVAYIERITRFIEWPQNNEKLNTSQFFTICVIGDEKFSFLLEKALLKRKINNKTIKFIYAKGISDLPDCDLLYISKANSKYLHKIIDRFKGKPTLTISNEDGFAEKGVMINLYQVGDRMSFEINEQMCIKSGLVFSYHLFRQAKIINPIGNK